MNDQIIQRVVKMETTIESQKEILMAVRDDIHLITQTLNKMSIFEERLDTQNKRIEVLEDTKASIIKFVFGAIGTAVAGAFAIGFK